MKKSILKYILVGVGGAALFLVFFAFVGSLLHSDKTFADGFKSIFDWILAIMFGSSAAYSLWKKHNSKK